MKIHFGFQLWDHWIWRHCVGCMWNKGVFVNTRWKWKLSLAMMFWLRHFSVTTFTERSEEIWASVEYRAFFKHKCHTEIQWLLLSILLSPPRNIYQGVMLTSCFPIAVFILKKHTGNSAHEYVGMCTWVTFTDMCTQITSPKTKLKSALKPNNTS